MSSHVREQVGDFYVHLVNNDVDAEQQGGGRRGRQPQLVVDKNLTSSTKLLAYNDKLFGSNGIKKPTVIHFYDGGCGGCRPCAAQMELWASTIPQVQFICVCVESKQVAIMFHQMFSFKHAKNGYIPSNEYMPRGFGQLGCSGFIISDINGNFITRKSSAYLQYGENAFRNVEKILNSELHVMNNDTTTAPPVASAVIDLTEEEQPSKSKSKTIIMKPPKSVGVESMDDEHVECTNSFNRVLKDPSYENLDELYTILKMHFEHEENLIGLYSPNSSGSSSFSKLTSHKMDHDRILSIAKNELERVENNAPSASASTSCSMPQPGQPRVCHTQSTSTPSSCSTTAPSLSSSEESKSDIDIDVVYQLIDSFHIHADTFDILYQKQIPLEAK